MSKVEWVVDEDVLNNILSSHPEVVIDFTGISWCVPCQRFAPHYERAAEQSEAKFVAVDIDEAPWAVLEYGIQSVPTVKLYRHGEFDKDLKARTVIKLLAEIQS